MRRLEVWIPTSDGRSDGTLHVPDGDGPWPGVLMFPDAGGPRETFGQMGDRLADLGYVVLIPDIYYRGGRWAPFDVNTLFTDPKERARMSTLARPLTNDRIIADARAYADFLLARPEVTGPAIGTTGYCLGGRMSMVAAGGLGDTIAAAASFHGGRLAVDGDPSSPHLAADRIAATVYVAGALATARSRPRRPGCSTARSPRPESSTRWRSIRPGMASRCRTTRPTTPTRTRGTGRRSAGCTRPASERGGQCVPRLTIGAADRRKSSCDA